MADWKELGVQLGIDFPTILAGLAGGAVKSLVMKENKPIDIVPSMLAGALTANYLGDWIGAHLGVARGAAAFIVGISAMVIVQLIIEGMRRLVPSLIKGPSNGA